MHTYLLQARQVGGPVRGQLPEGKEGAVLGGEVFGFDVGVEVLLGPGRGGVAAGMVWDIAGKVLCVHVSFFAYNARSALLTCPPGCCSRQSARARPPHS